MVTPPAAIEAIRRKCLIFLVKKILFLVLSFESTFDENIEKKLDEDIFIFRTSFGIFLCEDAKKSGLPWLRMPWLRMRKLAPADLSVSIFLLIPWSQLCVGIKRYQTERIKGNK